MFYLFKKFFFAIIIILSSDSHYILITAVLYLDFFLPYCIKTYCTDKYILIYKFTLQ